MAAEIQLEGLKHRILARLPTPIFHRCLRRLLSAAQIRRLVVLLFIIGAIFSFGPANTGPLSNGSYGLTAFSNASSTVSSFVGQSSAASTGAIASHSSIHPAVSVDSAAPIVSPPASSFRGQFGTVVNPRQVNNGAGSPSGGKISSTPGVNASGTWMQYGPTTMEASGEGANNAGRLTSVIASGGNLIVGSAGGGIWTSSDNGKSWTPRGDSLPDLAIGSLAVDPANSAIVLAGSGENDNCGDCFPGDGIYISTDNGVTWATLQNSNFSGTSLGTIVGSLVVLGGTTPATLQIVAGTTNGLYYTSNGGSTWSSSSSFAAASNVTSLVSVPATTSGGPALFAGASVPQPTLGGYSLGVYESTDGGATWVQLTNNSSPNLPAITFNASRPYSLVSLGIYLGTSLASSELVASFGTEGGYKGAFISTNGGATWSTLSTPPFTNINYAYSGSTILGSDQSFYDNAVAIDPLDRQHIVLAGIAVIESTDGGATWSNVNALSSGGTSSDGSYFSYSKDVLHPDFHGVYFSPTNVANGLSNQLYLTGDGGLFGYQYTGTPEVTALNKGLDTAQLYPDVAVSADNLSVTIGTQDNGGLENNQSGPTAFTTVLSGDGSYAQIDKYNSNIQYVEVNNQIYYTNNNWLTSVQVSSSNMSSSQFVSPLTIDPLNSSSSPYLFFGGDSLWESANPVSSNATWANVLANVGVTAIAVSQSNPNDVYVGTSTGSIYFTSNAVSAYPNPTFSKVSNPSNTNGVATGYGIEKIAIDPSNDGQIYVITNDRSGGSPTFTSVSNFQVLSVAVSSTAVGTFSDITGNFTTADPLSAGISAVAVYQGSPILASSDGVFGTTSVNGVSTSWGRFGSGLPNVQVVGLTVSPSGEIYAATHGRGLWTLNGSFSETLGVTTPQTLTPNTPFTVTVNGFSSTGSLLSGDSTTAVALSLVGAPPGTSATLSCSGLSNESTLQSGTTTESCTVNQPLPQVSVEATATNNASMQPAFSASLVVSNAAVALAVVGAPPTINTYGSAIPVSVELLDSSGSAAYGTPIPLLTSWITQSNGTVTADACTSSSNNYLIGTTTFYCQSTFYNSSGTISLSVSGIPTVSIPIVVSLTNLSFGTSSLSPSVVTLNTPFTLSVGLFGTNGSLATWLSGINLSATPLTSTLSCQSTSISVTAGVASVNCSVSSLTPSSVSVQFATSGVATSTLSFSLQQRTGGGRSGGTPDGKGYWLVASDGGIFTFGDAGFYGSAGGTTITSPVVGISPTPSGLGYWLVDAGTYSSPTQISSQAFGNSLSKSSWTTLETNSQGTPVVFSTTMAPRPAATPASIVMIKQSNVAFALYAGYDQPSGNFAHTTAVAQSLRSSLLAAFNGGFRLDVSNGGFYSDGVQATPLRSGAASFVISPSGQASIGMWGRDFTLNSNIYQVRQNLNLLVDGGRIAPDANVNGDWGATVGGVTYDYRSAIGSDIYGNLYYVSGPGLSAFDLANIMVHLGVVEGMQLDINSMFPLFVSYHNGVGYKLRSDMYYGADHYTSSTERDFFALFTK